MNPYSTAVPVLGAVLKTVKVNTALELGAGVFSTPFLYQRVPFFTCLENDYEWFQKMRSEIACRDGFELRYHNVGPLNRCDVIKSTHAHQRAIYADFYNQRNSGDLLFIDHYLALRAIALKCLYTKYKVIVLHDSEEPHYGYDPIVQRMKNNGWLSIRISTLIPMTTVLFSPAIKDDIDKAQFISTVKTQIEEWELESEPSEV